MDKDGSLPIPRFDVVATDLGGSGPLARDRARGSGAGIGLLCVDRGEIFGAFVPDGTPA